MAHKARLFGDEEAFARIIEAKHPRQAKELGRKISSFDETTWVAQRFEIVTAGNVAKFGQHPDLNAYPLGTGSPILVEASPLDRIWGIGMAPDDDHATQPHQWRGLNLSLSWRHAPGSLQPDGHCATGSVDARSSRAAAWTDDHIFISSILVAVVKLRPRSIRLWTGVIIRIRLRGAVTALRSRC